MRQCGVCQACCEVLGIQPLGKPMFNRCQHQCAAGCGIYGMRPDVCRGYECLWLQGKLKDGQRPDKLGLVFSISDELDDKPTLLICETRAGVIQELGPTKLGYLVDKLGTGLPVVLVPYGCQLPLVFPPDERYAYAFPPDFGIDCRVWYEKWKRFHFPRWTESGTLRVPLALIAGE